MAEAMYEMRALIFSIPFFLGFFVEGGGNNAGSGILKENGGKWRKD